MLFCNVGYWVGWLIDYATGSRIAGWLIYLVLILPNLAVQARRLHDIDRAGWWLMSYPVLLIVWLLHFTAGVAYYLLAFFVLVALVLSIVLLVWCCKRGTIGPNRYGPNPLAGVA